MTALISSKLEEYRMQFETNAASIKELEETNKKNNEEIRRLLEVNLQLKGAYIALNSLLESDPQSEEPTVEETSSEE